ncbi:MAG TPA: carboxypeptidase-like regulatory domain-containing protein [Terriglobales bacterium]|nr:carboxypeptidase-like regulatory domain-containing protein [Terriglobales bacterium]
MKLGKLGLKLGLLGIALALPALAADRPSLASVSGYVRSAAGVPQMGAMVEVLGSAAHSLKVFTDENGFYTASGLLPGIYSIKAYSPSFLPTFRDRIGLRPGSSVMVDLKLSGLFDAIQLPALRSPSADDDDWKWVLRSVSSRPILRMLEDGTKTAAAGSAKASGQVASDLTGDNADSHDLKGTLSFVAGSASDGFGSASDMSTVFSVEKSVFSSGTMALQGDVGYGSGSPSAVLRAAYSRTLSNGAKPEIALTMRRLAAPGIDSHNEALQALALSASDDFTLGDVLELRFGSELQTIQFLGRVTAFRPFGSADLHLSPNTVLEYRYATSEPDGRVEKGFESAPADLSESGPHVSLAGFTSSLERAHHHEVSLSRRMGNTSLQIAMYSDRVADPALTGVGDASSDSGDVLPDLYSETFTYRGKELDAHGMRVVLQRKLASDLTATLDYGYGGVLDLKQSDISLQDARNDSMVRNRHTAAAKFSGKLPGTKTRWITSYRWISGQALTPVDMFNASAGQSDPYLNIYLRQPIPGTGFLPGHMDAVIDVRNLLAQGYVPLLGQDGRTVYLVQSARSIRGGVAFSF